MNTEEGRWLNGVTVPKGIWLGMTKGQWPVQAFPNQDMAARWAAKGELGHERVIFGPLAIPADIPMFKVQSVPATVKVVPL